MTSSPEFKIKKNNYQENRGGARLENNWKLGFW